VLTLYCHTANSFIPLGATALGEPWRPQQPVSIALCLSSSLSTALSSLLSSLLQHCPNIPSCHYQIRIPSFFRHLFHFFLIIPRLIFGFRNKLFLRCGVVSPTPNPQYGGPGYPFSSGSSPLTCLAWEALPVAPYRKCAPQNDRSWY
jgi:hypothetical protein